MPGADAAVQINRGRRHAPTSCSRLRRRRPCRLRHRLYLSGRLRRLLLRTAFGRLLRLRLRCALRQHLWLPALLRGGLGIGYGYGYGGYGYGYPYGYHGGGYPYYPPYWWYRPHRPHRPEKPPVEDRKST